MISGKRLFSYNALKIKYDKQNGNKEVWEPGSRSLHLDDLEILNQYNAEIRGLYNYYRLANNVSVLNNFYYVTGYSMLKTFAENIGHESAELSASTVKERFYCGISEETARPERYWFYNNGFR